MPAYYTTNDESRKVFHVLSDCPEAKNILDKDKVTVLAEHQLCKVCAEMVSKES
jgi:hypothetical protein